MFNQLTNSEIHNIVFRDLMTKEPILFYEKVLLANLLIDGQPIAASGGKADLDLVGFNQNSMVTFTLDFGTFSLELLQQLLNGKLVRTINTAQINFHQKSQPSNQIINLPNHTNRQNVFVYKLQSNGILWERKLLSGEFSISGNQLIFTNTVNNTDWYFIMYDYTTVATELHVDPTVPISYFTMDGEIILKNKVKGKADSKLYITIPRGRIYNTLELMLSNLDNEDQSFKIVFQAMKPEKQYGNDLIILKFI